MIVRVLQFASEADTEKCLLYLHCRGLSDMAAFRAAYPSDTVADAPGIPGYSALRWSTVAECRAGDGSNAWAVPMNDNRIDAVLGATPTLVDEFAALMGVQFSDVDSGFWAIPE